MKEPPANIVKSAARVLEIFELFDEVRVPVTINDVAERLGYPHSSAAALLKSLNSLGYLEFEPESRTFFPSVRISLLGHWVESESLPVHMVQSLMENVFERSGATVIMAIRSGVYAQYVKVLQSSQTVRNQIKTGTRRLLFESTLGRVLLAQMEDSAARTLIEEGIKAASCTVTTVAEVMGEIRKIKRRGYASYSGLIVPQAALLAVPLNIDTRGRPAALGIAAPQDRINPRKKELIELLNREVVRAEKQVPQVSLA